MAPTLICCSGGISQGLLWELRRWCSVSLVRLITVGTVLCDKQPLLSATCVQHSWGKELCCGSLHLVSSLGHDVCCSLHWSCSISPEQQGRCSAGMLLNVR